MLSLLQKQLFAAVLGGGTVLALSAVEYQIGTGSAANSVRIIAEKSQAPLKIRLRGKQVKALEEQLASGVFHAVMLYGKPLQGVTIEADASGAGTLSCGNIALNLLAAVQNKTLKRDFAVAGTVMPDGTLGDIPDLASFVRNAAKSGIRRIFIPAWQTKTKEQGGESVECDVLAKQTGVELIGVTHLFEAAQKLDLLPAVPEEYINVRMATGLRRNMEEALRACYSKVRAKVKALPAGKEQWPEITGFPCSSAAAETLWAEERQFPALEALFHTWQVRTARQKSEYFYREFMKKNGPDWSRIKYLKEYHYRKVLKKLRQASVPYVRKCRLECEAANASYAREFYTRAGKRVAGYCPPRPELSSLSAQFEPVLAPALLKAKLEVLRQSQLPETVLEQASLEELQSALEQEKTYLLLETLSNQPSGPWADLRAVIGAEFPHRKADPGIAEACERLFYAAAAACKAAEKHAGNDTRNAALFRILLRELGSASEAAHELLHPAEKGKNPLDRPYHLLGGIKVHLSVIAAASVRKVFLESGNDSRRLFLLRKVSRMQALTEITRCRQADVPCYGAIADFEIGEHLRNTPEECVKALFFYWRSSLLAKALYMNFKNTQDRSL